MYIQQPTQPRLFDPSFLERRLQELHTNLNLVSHEKINLERRLGFYIDDELLYHTEHTLLLIYQDLIQFFNDTNNITDITFELLENTRKRLNLHQKKISDLELQNVNKLLMLPRYSQYALLFNSVFNQVSNLLDNVKRNYHNRLSEYIATLRGEVLGNLHKSKKGIPLQNVLDILQFKSEEELLNYLYQLPIKFKLAENHVMFSDSKNGDDSELIVQLSDTATTFSVKCTGHGARVNMLDAFKAGWQICKECGVFLCSTCINHLTHCPNLATKNPHRLSIVGLPLESILSVINIVNKNIFPSDEKNDIIWMTKNENNNKTDFL
ncbi:MAG: hypothetical protein ACXAC7_15810 [Candidatus Hodarchaeales archaeon]|jgi:hypothetical protein